MYFNMIKKVDYKILLLLLMISVSSINSCINKKINGLSNDNKPDIQNVLKNDKGQDKVKINEVKNPIELLADTLAYNDVTSWKEEKYIKKDTIYTKKGRIYVVDKFFLQSGDTISIFSNTFQKKIEGTRFIHKRTKKEICENDSLNFLISIGRKDFKIYKNYSSPDYVLLSLYSFKFNNNYYTYFQAIPKGISGIPISMTTFFKISTNGVYKIQSFHENFYHLLIRDYDRDNNIDIICLEAKNLNYKTNCCKDHGNTSLKLKLLSLKENTFMEQGLDKYSIELCHNTQNLLKICNINGFKFKY